jgi:calpain-15
VKVDARNGEKKEKVLKLRNPWGKFEWKGRWSDHSNVWTESLKKKLSYKNANDGTFWINIDDFISNFGQICACKYNKNYVNTSLLFKFPQ